MCFVVVYGLMLSGLGLIVGVCVRVCCCNVVVCFACDLTCDVVWLGCCGVVAVLLFMCVCL